MRRYACLPPKLVTLCSKLQGNLQNWFEVRSQQFPSDLKIMEHKSFTTFNNQFNGMRWADRKHSFLGISIGPSMLVKDDRLKRRPVLGKLQDILMMTFWKTNILPLDEGLSYFFSNACHYSMTSNTIPPRQLLLCLFGVRCSFLSFFPIDPPLPLIQ